MTETIFPMYPPVDTLNLALNSREPLMTGDVITYRERESTLLAPWAMFSHQSQGRKTEEQDQSYRSPFQRDRDRVLHSSAYRRLSDKTQVFTGISDYHRTRLTHTIEVASIARTIGRSLQLNEDLVEALAHLHDIGHPPFGHAGEDVLAECMEDVGRFSHNHFCLILVEHLETRSSDYAGLNLTHEVLESQHTRIDKSQADRLLPLLETQVVEAADSITYDAHDTDDAVKLGLVSIEQLMELPIVRRCVSRIEAPLDQLTPRVFRKMIARELIDVQVSSVLSYIAPLLQAKNPKSAEAARRCGIVVGTSPELKAEKSELERFLYHEVYRHPDIMIFRSKVQEQLRTLYEGYTKRPELLPEKLQAKIDDWGIQRAAGYYLATMTDSYCNREYEQHFGGTSGG